MLMSALAIYEHGETRTREEVRRSLAGNLCRCTGYESIVDAVEAALANAGSEAGR